METDTQDQLVLGEPGSPGVREQLFEVLTFCFIIVPGLAFSFVAGPAVKENFLLGIFGVMLSDLALVTLVLFFLWHNRENISRVGWTSRGWFKELVIGLVIFPAFLYGFSLLSSWLESLGMSFGRGHIPSFLQPTGTGQYVGATILVVIVAVCEETIFRGYLMLRFGAVTGSAVATVILSSFIFSIGHGYEGVGGAIIVGFMGAFFAVVYLWRKSLIAPMVLHFLQDFMAIVVVSVIAHE